jgi:hypothetical protein
VGFGGLTMLIEIKDPSQPPSKQRLTDDEVEFFSGWKGGVRIVRDVEDAAETINTLVRWHEAIRAGTLCGGCQQWGCDPPMKNGKCSVCDRTEAEIIKAHGRVNNAV